MEFRFLPKLIEFSKVFPPIALREIYAKTRTNHRMVVYTVCRGNSWFVDLKRECCFEGRASIYNDFNGSFFFNRSYSIIGKVRPSLVPYI